MAPFTKSKEDAETLVQETNAIATSNESVEFNSSFGTNVVGELFMNHEVNSTLDNSIDSLKKIELDKVSELKIPLSNLDAQKLVSDNILGSGNFSLESTSDCNILNEQGQTNEKCSILINNHNLITSTNDSVSGTCDSVNTCCSKHSEKNTDDKFLSINSFTSYSNSVVPSRPKENIKSVQQNLLFKGSNELSPRKNLIVNEEDIRAKDKNKLLTLINKLTVKIQVELLTDLILANLDLHSIDYDFSSFSNVTFVDVSCNNLTSLPQSFCSFSKCTRLIISKNKFSEVPHILYQGLYFIRDLDISFNSIKDFSMPPLCVSYLVNLQLNHNNLTSPPLWLLQDIPSTLKCLDISFNPCLKDKLSGLFHDTFQTNCLSSRILDLNISNTSLIPNNVHFLKRFTCLKILRLNSEFNRNFLQNSLEDLPSEILNLMPLEELEAKDCGLTCLPDNVDKLSHLKVLHISNNNISWLPERFVYLQCLSILEASKCHLVYLPREMELMTSLTELWLSYNDIPSLPDLKKCKNLKVLDLYSNGFSQLPDTLYDLQLEALDLCGNYFSPSTYKQAANGVSYESLKIRLREKLEDSNDRTDFIKIDYYSNNDFNSGSYSSSRSYNSRRSSRSNRSSPSSSYSRLSRASSRQDECWDVDPDEAWDPNLYCDISQYKSEESLSRVRSLASLTHKENYFCPFQERSNFFQNIFVSCTGPDENGQFDDA